MEEEIQNVVEETNENTEAQSVEEVVEGVELTDTTEPENVDTDSETKEDSKEGRFVTEEELNKMANEIAEKRVARKMSKLEREIQNKYKPYEETEMILKTALGASNIVDANQRLRNYYKGEGIEVPEYVSGSSLSEHEEEIIAKTYADEIIEDGYDSMLREANELAKKGFDNMTNREKIIFKTLGDKLNEENDKKELLKLGAKEELLKDEEFKSFRGKFNSKTPIKDIYSLYKNMQPKPKVVTPGSMRNQPVTNEVKEFYTKEEAEKFTVEDFNKNPKLFEAVEKSSYKW